MTCRLAELEVLHLRVLHGQLILDIDGDHVVPCGLPHILLHHRCQPALHAAALLSTAVAAGLVLDSPKLRQLVVTAGILAISCSPDEAEDQVRRVLDTYGLCCTRTSAVLVMHIYLAQVIQLNDSPGSRSTALVTCASCGAGIGQVV